MSNSKPAIALTEESPAVQSHLSIEQQVIQRMAGNSTSCKASCITLVSAILVVVADKGKPNLTMLAFPAAFMFLALDAYYLALERMFRASYRQFISRLHSKELTTEDLFVITPTGELFRSMLESLISFSILPFYVTLFFMIAIIRWLVV